MDAVVAKDSHLYLGSRRYRASVLTTWPPERTESVQHAEKCMFGVSLGSDRFEGGQLEACVEWISENFSSCAVVVGDSVYRLTLQLLEGLEEADARQQAIETGEDFVRRNSSLFRHYGNKCRFEFTPLSRVQELSTFAVHHAALESVYQNDSRFRQAVSDFANQYLNRGEKDVVDPGGVETARRYLLEESALFASLQEQGWPILVYPGSIESMQGLFSGLYPGTPEPLTHLTFVSLSLRHRGCYFSDGSEKVLLSGNSTALNSPFGPQEFLARLNESDWITLLKSTKLRKFSPREVILAAGGEDRSLCILLSGRAEVTVTRADGSQQQLSVLDEDTVFGELSFLDGFPRSATVTALSECEVRTLNPRQFRAFQETHPAIACQILTDIGRILAIRCRRQTFDLLHVR